jgi:hypothetical protein
MGTILIGGIGFNIMLYKETFWGIAEPRYRRRLQAPGLYKYLAPELFILVDQSCKTCSVTLVILGPKQPKIVQFQIFTNHLQQIAK